MVWLLSISPLGSGFFLGWSLGANDAGHVFGTAVAARIIRFGTAAFLCALCVMLGAALQGTAGIATLSGITHQTISTAVVVTVATAVAITVMTVLSLPVSTSQAVVGGILGIGLSTGHAEYQSLIKVVVCWIGTPVGAMVVAAVVYRGLAYLVARVPMSVLTRDKILWAGLLVVGMYGSYALGANNVANTTGIFSGLLPGVSDRMLAVLGGLSIGIGAITFGRRVMMSIGSGIMFMDAFTALVAVLAMSLNVHLFAMIGAPVSTSQGIVGAIFGIGLLRGVHTLHFRVLRDIVMAWLATPVVALVLAAAGFAIFC